MKGIEALKSLVDTQCSNGNWNYSPYMRGLANGLILAYHNMAELSGDPAYLLAPERYLCDLPEVEPIVASESVTP